MIDTQINELVAYGLKCGLVSKDDQIFVTNQLLDLFRLAEFHEEEILKSRPLAEILEDMVSYAHQQGILEEDTIAWKDLFDTRIMGLLTPLPSVVRSRFQSLYREDRKKATDYFYKLSQDTNYIRTDRIAKDEKWVTDTEYGPIDITINLSKPEKRSERHCPGRRSKKVPDIQAASYAKRTKGLQEIFLIRQGRTTG